MAATKDVSDVFDLILLSPGLDAHIKLDSRITCRTALFVVIALEYGIASGEASNPLKKILSEEDQGTLKELAGAILERAKLQAFYEKLKKLA